MPDTSYKALQLIQEDKETAAPQITSLPLEAWPEGEVTIRVAYSSVNYKDGLAAVPGRVVKRYPIIPGIDLSGTVLSSRDPRFREGDEVLVTGYDLGVSWNGGFAEVARVPADWVVPLPAGLSLREAMILGTAGFTAGLSVLSLERSGLRPGQGPVLVTGATGGVGSTAVDLLATRGYEVAAGTGKADEHGYLRELGASQVIPREELTAAEPKALRGERWAGAVDPVGGRTLEYVLTTLQYGGSVALSGLTGGADFAGMVYPFILRGVNLLGIDSVQCRMGERLQVWQELSGPHKPRQLERMVAREVGLDGVPGAMEEILQGRIRGRVLVKL